MYINKISYIFSEEELIKLCAYWQEYLELEHWSVALRVARANDFTSGNSQGECSWNIATGTALISILDPVDYPASPFLQDMEKTLVHELLHLHMANFDETKEGSLEEDYMERTVNTIAKTLVRLKREREEIINVEEKDE